MRSWQILFVVLSFALTSCGARKAVVTTNPTPKAERVDYADLPDFYGNNEEIVEEIGEEKLNVINYALDFLGTNYKYGGTSQEGMDCSGLVFTSFLKANIALPRSSKDMALLGNQLNLEDVKIGDLLFFITDRRKKSINHVGLVVELKDEIILFIHSSTSKGVIISALNENYWREHFVMARRIL